MLLRGAASMWNTVTLSSQPAKASNRCVIVSAPRASPTTKREPASICSRRLGA